MWLDGGAYNLVSTGQQFEGSRLNAILIDSDGANDLPRNIKFINTYFTGGGRIEDDSYNTFVVHVKDGVGVEFDSPLFNNLGCGIVFNKALTQGLVIRRPVVRTVRPYGATNGIFIDAYGTNVSSNRLTLEDPVFNQAPATYISEAAMQAFLTTAAGGRLSINNNAAVVSCTMGRRHIAGSADTQLQQFSGDYDHQYYGRAAVPRVVAHLQQFIDEDRTQLEYLFVRRAGVFTDFALHA